MWPFKRARSRWMQGLLHAEQAVREGGRAVLENHIEESQCFGDWDQFDQGVRDYLWNLDMHVRAELHREALHGSVRDCESKFNNILNFAGSRELGSGCGAKLAPGQYWSFCGETDMGQTLPALCRQCGGEFIRLEVGDGKATEWGAG